MNVHHDHLGVFCSKLLECKEVQKEDATFVAKTLIDADMRGHHSHGISLLPRYLEELDSGLLNPHGEVQHRQISPSIISIDAGGSLGQIGARAGVESVIELAADSGVGIVCVKNTGHFGAGSYWVELIAKQNMIGLATSTEPAGTVTPFGGIEPMMSNNPVAWSAPVADGEPFILDFATGIVADGKIRIASSEGNMIPTGWGLNSDGQTENNPGQVSGILSFGEAKGFGIGIITEILAGLLTADFTSTLVKDSAHNTGATTGQFFLAISVAKMTDLETFSKNLDKHLSMLKNSQPAIGSNGVTIPGQRAAAKRKHALVNGISLPQSVQSSLEKLAEQESVVTPW